MSGIMQSQIRIAAGRLASDAEICRICGVKPERLERYRAMIDAARAEAMVLLKYERAKVKARATRKDGSQ